jgi:galactose-1-phosphate uridylyltransferase
MANETCRDFFIQYPPYPYTTGHAVVIEKEHTRQIINANTSRDLLVFVDMFPGIYIARYRALKTGATAQDCAEA